MSRAPVFVYSHVVDITDLLIPYIPARNLRSKGEGYLIVPKIHLQQHLHLDREPFLSLLL